MPHVAQPFTLAARTTYEVLDPGVPEEYQDFWTGLTEYLDWFDILHWSERPLRPDWNHLRSDDREVAYVWSTEHLYAGCPDLIGEIGGVKVIADFKTSNGPYMNCFPDKGDRMGFGGWRKYQKCAQQMAAYRLALFERTGYKCDVALIIVSTPEISQGIFIDSDQMDRYEAKFLMQEPNNFTRWRVQKILKVAVNKNCQNKSNPQLVARNWSNVLVSIDWLLRLGCANGFGWCSTHFVDRHRLADNAAGSNMVVIDIDGDTTLDKFWETTTAKEWCLATYTSASHTEQEHRFRAIFALETDLESTRQHRGAYWLIVNRLLADLGLDELKG